MKSRIYLLMTVASVLLALAFSAFAQSGEGIPACTEEQLTSIAGVFEEFSTRFAPLYERVQNAAEDDLPRLITVVNAIQHQWWTITFPSLPDCAEAVRMSLVAGRMVDEALIAMALAHGGDGSGAESHIRQIAVLSEELTVLSAELPEVTAQETGSTEGAGIAVDPNLIQKVALGTRFNNNKDCEITDPMPAPVKYPSGTTRFALQIVFDPTFTLGDVHVAGLEGVLVKVENCNKYVIVLGAPRLSQVGATFTRPGGQAFDAGTYILQITINGVRVEVPFEIG